MKGRLCMIVLVGVLTMAPATDAPAVSLEEFAAGLRNVLHLGTGEVPLRSGGVDRWRNDIADAARRHGLDPLFLQAIVRCESNGDARAVSHKGAIGLCQLMPPTAAELGVNPRDPCANLDGGARYIKEQLLRFRDVRMALWAYNAGPQRVAAGRGVPRETKRYADDVIREYRRLKREASRS